MNRMRTLTAAYLGLAVLAAGLVLWGCGGQKPAEQTGQTPAVQTEGTGAVAPSGEPSLAMGDSIYKAVCASCHGMTGKGDGPAGQALNPKPRNHTDAAYMDKLTDQDIENVILNGKGTGMPPHKTLFNDTQVKSLVLKIRSLSHPEK